MALMGGDLDSGLFWRRTALYYHLKPALSVDIIGGHSCLMTTDEVSERNPGRRDALPNASANCLPAGAALHHMRRSAGTQLARQL